LAENISVNAKSVISGISSVQKSEIEFKKSQIECKTVILKMVDSSNKVSQEKLNGEEK